MWRSTLCLAVMILDVLAAAPAQHLSLKPLHVDTNLRAAIAVSTRFNSLIVDETRYLTLPVWAADFSPDEEVEFDQLIHRSFSQLELPEEPGWGLFTPAGDFMQLQVRLTDKKSRLGRVEFRDPQTWQLIASMWANPQRTEVSGTCFIPWDRREMVAEVLSDMGRVLARLAIDVGKFDMVIPVFVEGSFEPFCLQPMYCPHASPHPADSRGTLGHPYTPFGVKTAFGDSGESYSTAYVDFTNDNSGTLGIHPLHPQWLLWRKKTIINTLLSGRLFRVADEKAAASLNKLWASALQEQADTAVSPIPAPPYSEGCARWRVHFCGRARGVIVIPYERNKRNPTLTAFLAEAWGKLAGQRQFFSTIVAAAANEWLRDVKNQQASGLKPGEVLPWGDVYVVETEATPSFHRLLNLTQEWRVNIRFRYPDGSTAPAEGIVRALIDSPRTNPAPPSSAVPDTFVGKDGATIRLGKGWRWRLRVFAPGGEERLVDVPTPDPNPTITLYIQVDTSQSQPPGGK